MSKIARTIIALVLLAMATSLVGQDLPEGDPRNSDFRSHFTRILKANGNMQIADSYRMRPGDSYLLPSGELEFLRAGDTRGIWGHEFYKMYGYPYGEVKPTVTPTPTATLTPTPVPTTTNTSIPTAPLPRGGDPITWYDGRTGWFLLVLVFLLGALLLLAMENTREKELKRDPVTSGPAIVPGGISSTETTRLENYFQSQAGQIAFDHGMFIAPPVRISPIEEGMISGEGMVGYADRARRRKINPAVPGYRAKFRFPDGSERDLMSLEGCMNPCTRGEGMTGFNFVPGRIVVPLTPSTPEPTPEPATNPNPTPDPVVVVPEPTSVPPAPVAPPDGTIKIEVRQPGQKGPYMVKAEGVDIEADFDFDVDPTKGQIKFRFTPLKK